jgi:leader peptidase (prepilin peptidase) / N-methyltransferase
MTIEVILAAVYGLVLGSFLNVCVYRFTWEIPLTKPARSFCTSCLNPLAWYDNLPVLSYLLLGRKCRRCHQPIAWRYPLAELFTGIAFAVAIARYGVTPEGLKLCLYSWLLIGCLFADLEWRILPDEFTWVGMFVGLTLACVIPLPEPRLLPLLLFRTGWPLEFTNLLESALGAGLPTGIMWLVGLVTSKIMQRDALGLGDVKMVAMMGAFYGLGPTLVAVSLGSVFGLLCVPYLWATGQKVRGYEMPYGTFLALGALTQQFLLRPVSALN